MTNEKDQKENSPIKPDKGTTNTTDPQEHMEGPVSSLLKKTGEAFDSEETKEDADEKKEKGLSE